MNDILDGVTGDGSISPFEAASTDLMTLDPAAFGRCDASARSSANAAGTEVEALALATFDKVSYELSAHPAIDTLKAALYIISSADVDLDGSLSFEEAQESYQLTWDEYAWFDLDASQLEAPGISSVLFDVAETLRGRPWADRHTFEGADVAASATVKFLSRCDSTQIDEREARVLGIGAAGFAWADVDGSGALAVDELLQVLKKVQVERAKLRARPPEAVNVHTSRCDVEHAD